MTRLPLPYNKRVHNPVPWWFSHFSPSPLNTSRTSLFTPHQNCLWWTLILLKAYFSGVLNVACVFVSFKIGGFWTDTRKSVVYYANLFKPSEIEYHQAGHDWWPGEMRWERECEVRRTMLIRKVVFSWWSWFHAEEDVSGLSDSFCRWMKQDSRFSRANSVVADKGEPQAVGRPSYRSW